MIPNGILHLPGTRSGVQFFRGAWDAAIGRSAFPGSHRSILPSSASVSHCCVNEPCGSVRRPEHGLQDQIVSAVSLGSTGS